MEPADLDIDFDSALAALAWQVELGADEAVGDTPVNRYEAAEAERTRKAAAKEAGVPAPGPQTFVPPPAATTPEPEGPDPVQAARAAAARAQTLEALHEAIAGFGLCELKKGAKTTVFADGRPGARLMILGEAPGREEDIKGLPFVGRAGQLLDRMLAAIGLSRGAPDAEHAVYISNILPWRPPQNRKPTAPEMAMMMPFVQRHVELADPDVLVLMGNTPCEAVLGRGGITRIRGNWTQALDRPVLPMFHPAYLLRTPSAKREAWADLLALQAKLRETA